MEKIQELTEKLLHEGVEKGQAEAARIIAEAQQQAEQIVADARAQAEQIISDGEKQAGSLSTNTKNELKLYTAQALNALKSEVANTVTDKIVRQASEGLAQDKDFLKKFVIALAAQWVEDEPIVISTEDAESLKAYFAQEAKQLLDKGVEIQGFKGNSSKQTLFSISPADGSYRVDFGAEEFENYFKGFLRPQLVKMLF